MSSEQERYTEIVANYQNANNNEISDKANASTENQVLAIEANLAQAAAAFYSVTADILTAQGAHIEADFAAAKQANEAVAAARAAAAAIPDLLKKLTSATDAANKLALSAKSV